MDGTAIVFQSPVDDRAAIKFRQLAVIERAYIEEQRFSRRPRSWPASWFNVSPPQQHINHKTDEANRASLLLRTEIHLKQPMPTRLTPYSNRYVKTPPMPRAEEPLTSRRQEPLSLCCSSNRRTPHHIPSHHPVTTTTTATIW
ncbi:unnamed protein product [Nezara viridula]|uniref:Uncharacterized protein n=1 Tax=Nezara viridula TaxID=85310 RepID=A0A9P0E3G4_NEZVI|nr:unnamed protein product [Nezara viridula]